MSEEKRDYPEWLDRELFSDLDGSAPETDAAPAPDQGVTAPEEAATDTGKKKKKPAAEEDAAAEKPVKKKKKPVAEEEKTAPEEKRAKKKKKAAADETAAADAPVKKKKKSAEGKAAPAEAEQTPPTPQPEEAAEPEWEYTPISYPIADGDVTLDYWIIWELSADTKYSDINEHVVIQELLDATGAHVPLGTPYAAVVESDQPIVAQYSRLDTTQVNETLMTTIAYPLD